MLENLVNSPFLTSLALTLLHFLWQGLLVATVLKSALLIFDNNKPQLRYALSALAMIVNLLLPIITFIIVYRGELSSANTLANSLALNKFIHELKQPDILFSYKGFIDLLPTLLPYISILWLTTIALLAGKLLIEIYTVNKLPLQGTIPATGNLQVRFEQLVKQIQLTIMPTLLVSLKVEVPMAIGWLKPVVLLPISMINGLNSAQLEMLILHELAHIRRHDYLVNFLQTLIEILLFFHPAVQWVSKQMRNEREYCSDDIAVQHCGDAIAYAHTLADTASLCTKAHLHTIPDMAMAASGGDLKQRVIRLVDHHCAPNNNISKWLASATIIFSVLLLSSKQLLTMPILDIWYNENPWQQVNYASRNAGNHSLPNSSIAQQLLIPKALPPQSTQPKQVVLTQQAQPIKTAQTIDLSTSNQQEATFAVANLKLNSIDEPQTTLDDSKQYNATLDRLTMSTPMDTSTLPSNNMESTVASKTLMVDTELDRTNSHNPYQQELAQLATPQTMQATTNQQVPSANHVTLLAKTSALVGQDQWEGNSSEKPEITTKNFTQLNFSETAQISPTKSIWHNAKQLTSIDPVYPSVAKRKGIEIEIKVNFTINIDGHIKNIQFARQNKLNYFKSSIRTAIKKWRFLPAQIDGQPVESQMSKVFVFSLQS
ncbi:MAG: M56 family metallopeptidase [Colwellia sp.]|nr:M56 family metallopeptidase [Colwellia sp.]